MPCCAPFSPFCSDISWPLLTPENRESRDRLCQSPPLTPTPVSLDSDVGKVLQKQMAKLLSLGGASEEKMLGFPASEKARISKAWSWSMLFHKVRGCPACHSLCSL